MNSVGVTIQYGQNKVASCMVWAEQLNIVLQGQGRTVVQYGQCDSYAIRTQREVVAQYGQCDSYTMRIQTSSCTVWTVWLCCNRNTER